MLGMFDQGSRTLRDRFDARLIALRILGR